MAEKSQVTTWYDEDKVDEAALALLWLSTFRTRGEEPRGAWTAMAREILARLEQRGYVTGSLGGKSICLTEEGQQRSEESFKRLFGKPRAASIAPLALAHVVQEEDGE